MSQILQPHTYRVTRADLARYSKAADDHNPIHWSDSAARAAGLPGVVAHGMYVMGLAGRSLALWASGSARVTDYSVRFTRPLVVPDDPSGVVLTVAGTLTKQGDMARIELTVCSDGEKVLSRAQATVIWPRE